MIYNLTDQLDYSKILAFEAGKEILRIYKKDFSVEYKKDESPLTEADKISNDIIVNGLKKRYPGHAVLAEESEDDKTRLSKEWCWIIDPLDGTKEFVKKNDEFSINIALTYKHLPVLGIVYIPVTEELYFATKNQGAYYQKNNVIKKIQVSERVHELILVKSRSHESDKLEKLIAENQDKISGVITSGSAIKGCLVAKGDADIYYRFNYTMEWDTASVQCIVEEAGGIFRQMDDSQMIYNRENSLNEKGFYIINRIENKFQI